MSVYLDKNNFDQSKFEQNLDEFTELVNNHDEVKFNSEDPDFLEEYWTVAERIGDTAIDSFYKLFNSAPFEQKTRFCTFNTRVKKSSERKSKPSEQKTQNIFRRSCHSSRSLAGNIKTRAGGWKRSFKAYHLKFWYGCYAFDHAKSIEDAEALIKAGADVNKRDDLGETPLHRVNDKGIAKTLIKAGSRVNARNNCGKTPLHYAADKEIIETLTEAGADVNARDNSGKTPLQNVTHELYVATHYDRSSKISKCPECRELIFLKRVGEDRYLPQYILRILALIKAGADVKVRDLGETPLHIVVDSCLESRYEHFNKQRCSKRCERAAGDFRKVVKALVKAGADVNAKDNSGETPLHRVKNKEITEALIEAGADVHARDNLNTTPLHNFCKKSSRYVSEKGIIVVLINAGADVKTRNNLAQTPLDCVEDEFIIKTFVEVGAWVDPAWGWSRYE